MASLIEHFNRSGNDQNRFHIFENRIDFQFYPVPYWMGRMVGTNKNGKIEPPNIGLSGLKIRFLL